ncbi:OmpA family protein [Micromonospora coxensis]|uniref:OmpA-OmpF porin, OOP family n=1 Tax=Micromonospora coxensis TaxID=356852 RepID=A0A1C5JBI4_9ACTN|nr:OmpA family protein [Micromonospora coxensis]SCG67937.1 OmpA-OmpF porin, OOP family [Micromonospora coxensis]
MRRRVSRSGRAALAVVGVAALIAVPACTDDRDACEVLGDPPPIAGVAHTAVLIDVTASTRSTGAAPDWAAAVAGPVEAAIERRDVVSIGTFDGSAATVTWAIENRVTAPTSTTPDNQEYETEATRSCLRRVAAQAAATAPRTAGTDVLGALGVAAEQTRAAGEARRTVVLATDGLSTTGCTDLSRAPVGGEALIDAAVRDCPDRPEWPTSLVGADLLMVGVGNPVAGRPVPETGHLAWLRQYWERLCLTVPAASCEVSTAPAPTRQSGVATSPPADPVVLFKPGAGPPPTPPDITYSLPSAALFANESDVVGPEGVARLGAVRERIGNARVSRVEIVGHTDSRGGAAYNKALSERRAAAVGRELARLGLPVSVTRGVGETRRICLHERRNGGWDEECLGRNRRVEIVITRESG